MTVCLATVCENSRIIGVADRMLTAGDIEFEPEQAKIWPLTTSVVAMVSGDSTVQIEILNRIQPVISDRILAEPANWWGVRDVAELYASRQEEIRLERAERQILAPLGLNTASFLANQSQMASNLVDRLVSELSSYALPGTAAIIAGSDTQGPQTPDRRPGTHPHLYVVNGSQIHCYDGIGFAAIGIGDWHAQSQCMFAKHTRWRPFPETLLLTYSAKRHAEVAPGVGRDTDMFTVGPALGSWTMLGPHVISALERIYRHTQEQLHLVNKASEASIKGFVDEITRAAESVMNPQATRPDTGPQPPADIPAPSELPTTTE